MEKKQVFQTDNSTRWTGFKWSLRVVLMLVLLLLAALVLMLFLDKLPGVPFRRDYRSAMSATAPFYRETELSKEYRGFRQTIHARQMHNDYEKIKTSRNLKSLARRNGLPANAPAQQLLRHWQEREAGVRAAFYVSWDKESYHSLRRNIRHLNLVFPEWLFLDSATDTLRVTTDPRALRLMRRAGVPVMPLLTNAEGGVFNARSVQKLLASTQRQQQLIDCLVNLCRKERFAGVNIDFEEVDMPVNEPLTAFVQRLSAAFHKHGLLVAQSVMVFNDDYNLRALAPALDYVVLMAYDESVGTTPGPISSQRWVEAAVDKALQDMPAEKLILGLAGYGYSWKPGERNTSLSYHEAMTLASASRSKVLFDDDTYCLSFAYYDDKGVKNTVFFNDAATTFNIMRFGREEGVGGFALWRLGSEDARTWHFYDKPMDKASLAHFNFKRLQHIDAMQGLDYVGEGEVLNVVNTPKSGNIALQFDTDAMLIAEEHYKQLPGAYEVQRFGYSDDKKLCLTFDDGPDPVWTPKILDILKQYDVPAAFFLVGLQAEQNLPIVREEFKRGYLLGNHTFTHPNIAEVSPHRTLVELRLTRLLIEAVTGHSTILFRAPYNADSEPSSKEEVLPVILAREQNYLDVGESIDPEDWEPGITADSIVARVLRGVENGYGNIILLHDAGGDTRKATVEALPVIIEKLRAKGYRFTSLSDLVQRPASQLMPAVPKGKDYYLMQANLVLASVIYWLGRLLYALFLIFMALGFVRLLVMVVLTLRERRREKREEQQRTHAVVREYPAVSVIVPAYNEEVNAVSSLQNLLKQNYPNYNVVFVDDGSKDRTFELVSRAFANNPKVKVLTKPNGGKASALNTGIAATDAPYVVCIDADTKLYPDAVTKLMAHFMYDDDRENIGAVAGNVKVGNVVNMLTAWQSIEYITSQNFDRQAYAALNAVTVVPGAIGAFRKEAVLRVGGFTTDTLAEDCDLTVRILRGGYLIKNENRAVAVTEAPESLSQFEKQRVRWSFGVMQTFWKHRDTLFNRKYKGLGLWAMPNMLVFQFVIPYFSPLADLTMLLGLLMDNGSRILVYYLLFTLVDSSVSVAAFLFEKEKLSRLWWIVPQRFGYRWIMYKVMFKSLLKAIKGELQTWGVLTRTGKVKDV